MTLCHEHKTLTRYALLNDEGTATLCNMCDLRDQISSLQKQLEEKDQELFKTLIANGEVALLWAESQTQLTASRETAKRLREGLGKLEWCVFDGVDERTQCPSCEQYNPESQHEDWVNDLYGHKPDCWLKALIGDGE